MSAYSPEKDTLVVVFRDNTRSKVAEKALTESEKRFRALFEQSTEALFVIDSKGNIRDVNEVACRRLGYTKKELLTFHLKEIDPDYVRQNQNLSVLEELIQTAPLLIESRHRCKDGKFFPVEVCIRPVRYGGRRRILASARDISQRKTLENEKQALQDQLSRMKKMEALGLMAGGVAHDLNNVLSSLISYPELMLMNPMFPEKFRPSVERIKEGGLRAAAIVSDLLTIARGVAVRKEVGNLNGIIDAYLKSPEHRKLMEHYPAIPVHLDLAPGLHNISCSPIHIRKIVMNLMINAAEAIDGAGNIRVTTRNQTIGALLKGREDIPIGEYCILSIADNGPGISDDDKERIFEPFYSKKMMGRSGSGLGLTVVWNSLRDHQGYIDVLRGTDQTVFELYFPASRQMQTDEQVPVNFESIKGAGESILVVDDDDSQREIAAQILTGLGYRVETAKSGEAAIAFAAEKTFDLIVLDMIMDPGINGRQTYESMVRNRPGQKAIIVSGFAETGDVLAAQQLGAGAFVKKPYTRDMIGLAIKRELMNRNPRYSQGE